MSMYLLYYGANNEMWSTFAYDAKHAVSQFKDEGLDGEVTEVYLCCLVKF